MAEITTDEQRAAVEAYVAEARAENRPRPHRPGQGQDRRLHRRLRRQPGQRRADPDLGRRLRAHGLRHRRHHGGAGPRRARPRVRPRVRPADHRGRVRRRRPDRGGGLHRPRRRPGELDRQGRLFLDGLKVPDAIAKITDWLVERGLGEGRVQYRLRDWLFSRQRYWGEPFPIVHTDDGEVVPLPETSCRSSCRRSTSTSPPTTAGRRWPAPATTGCGSSCPTAACGNPRDQHHAAVGGLVLVLPALPRSPQRPDEAWSQEAENYWMPVDLYVGGVEHAVLHLLYARFWHKVLYDCGSSPPRSRSRSSSTRA